MNLAVRHNLVEFPALRSERIVAAIPAPLEANDCFVIIQTGDSMLSDDGDSIPHDAEVVINKIFNVADIKETVCAVRVQGIGEILTYVRRNEDASFTLAFNNSAYPAIVGSEAEIEIVGVMLYRLSQPPTLKK